MIWHVSMKKKRRRIVVQEKASNVWMVQSSTEERGIPIGSWSNVVWQANLPSLVDSAPTSTEEAGSFALVIAPGQILAANAYNIYYWGGAVLIIIGYGFFPWIYPSIPIAPPSTSSYNFNRFAYGQTKLMHHWPSGISHQLYRQVVMIGPHLSWHELDAPLVCHGFVGQSPWWFFQAEGKSSPSCETWLRSCLSIVLGALAEFFVGWRPQQSDSLQ